MEAGHGVGDEPEVGSSEEPEVGSGEEVGSSEEPEVGSDEEAEVESGEELEELSEGSEAEEASPEQLLAMGKKCLAASDATGAVDHFQEACSLLLVPTLLLHVVVHQCSIIEGFQIGCH